MVLSWETLIGKKTQQSFFIIDLEIKYNVGDRWYPWKKNPNQKI